MPFVYLNVESFTALSLELDMMGNKYFDYVIFETCTNKLFLIDVGVFFLTAKPF